MYSFLSKCSIIKWEQSGRVFFDFSLMFSVNIEIKLICVHVCFCDLAASISYCSFFSSNLAIYRDIAYWHLNLRNGFFRNEPQNSRARWPLHLAAAAVMTGPKINGFQICFALQDRSQHCLHSSTCCGVEMFTNPRTQLFVLATSYAVIINLTER